MRTAVMVAELKNFYSGAGADDNERLATKSNRFLELMSKCVHKYGGDVVQFLGGNSIIALWLPNLEPREDSTARKALQCALDLRAEDICIGLGFGHVGLLHVGGVFNRVEYLVLGDALNQALAALNLSSKEESVVISGALADMVRMHFQLETLKKSHLIEADQFSVIEERAVTGLLGEGVRSKVNTLVQRAKIE